MAYGVACYSFLFFIVTIKQRTNFCNFATKVNKIAKLLSFLVPLSTKLLELYYDVTVEISPILLKTFGQITAKQQNIKSELQWVAHPSNSGEAKKFKSRGCDNFHIFSRVIFSAEQI